MEDEAIDALLRKTRFRPSAAETELFVLKVMAALPAPVLETVSWLAQPWFAPTMGLAFAALVVSLIPAASAVEDESALLLGGPEWTQPAAPQSADEVLGMVLESR